MPVTDQFAGAEAQVDQDKAAALATLAQFGRAGLEQSVLTAKKSSTAAKTAYDGTNEIGNTIGVSDSMQKELDAIVNPGTQAYAADSAARSNVLQTENAAAAKVNGLYFDQARQAVPAMRSSAAAIQEQYRKAYEQRQADVAAQIARDAEMRRQAALQEQAIRDQMEQDRQEAERQAEIDRLVLLGLLPASSVYGGTGAYTPGFVPGSRRIPIS
jgi:hypothetical protein